MKRYNMLVLSAGHVSQETAKLMDQNGWFVHIPDKGMDFKELEDSKSPADLYHCMKYASDNDYGQ